ncbi:MAG: LysM peptidoglycan-binding domain-containing protein [Spirochaetales bacterium]|nr:LysM peptidoglycan-binding domain-containing protein [Spirochaetales bacterium]
MINRHTLSKVIFAAFLVISLSGQTIDHTVQKGDTLYSLSRKYGVSIDLIMEQNGLASPDDLKMGIILQIPQNHLDYNENNWYIENSEYFVERGDTLYSISRRNGISVDELRSLNSLSENHVLHIGDRLLVKGGSGGRNGGQQPLPGSEKPDNGDSGLLWPVPGTRYRMDGKLEGVRIDGEAYSYVRSIAAGKVVLAEPYRGFGNVILIDVNGYIYLYGGNEDIFVNVGEEVTAGTRIGRLGVSEDGKQDMFFSVFKDGKPVDTYTAPRG